MEYRIKCIIKVELFEQKNDKIEMHCKQHE